MLYAGIWLRTKRGLSNHEQYNVSHDEGEAIVLRILRGDKSHPDFMNREYMSDRPRISESVTANNRYLFLVRDLVLSLF